MRAFIFRTYFIRLQSKPLTDDGELLNYIDGCCCCYRVDAILQRWQWPRMHRCSHSLFRSETKYKVNNGSGTCITMEICSVHTYHRLFTLVKGKVRHPDPAVIMTGSTSRCAIFTTVSVKKEKVAPCRCVGWVCRG